MPTTRPATISELAAAVAETAAPPGRDLKHYMRVAERHRRAGAAYMGRALSYANPASGSSGGAGGGGAEAVGLNMERAFIEYACAATLIVDTIPAHRDYLAGLRAEQRRNLQASGQNVLDDMDKLKAALVERFERYTRAGGSTADAVPLFKAAAAMAANAQQQQNQQRAPPASVTSTASSAGRDSQATPVYQPNTSSMTTALDSVEKEWISSLKMPKNFIFCAFSLLQQTPQGPTIEIRNMLQQWVRWDVLESLASYHSVVKLLFGVLKDALRSTQLEASHVLAEEIFQCLSQDLYDLEEQLVAIFRDSESYKNFLACRGDLAQRLLDLLQDLLDSFPESSARPRLSKALERLSRVSGLQPTCFSLPGLVKVDQQVAAGGFGDIWKGLVGELSVSVKMMRLFQDADMKEAMQEFRREALIWRQLSHPNLLPFFGLYYLENRLCLVSPWMSNGHIIEFLKNAPPDTDRVSLMLDIAMGVNYLHENRIVHGDLKGMNVLVTPSCRACVADFGLASIAEAVTLRFTHSTASPKGGTARYQAPELLSTEIPNHFGSDVYAFGSVCYEILIGKAPFFEISRDITVTIKVLEGLRPSRPVTVPVDDDLWRLLQDCWQATPSDRPNISQIIQRLVGTIGAKSADAIADWDESISSKSRRSLQEWPLRPSIAAIERLILGKGNLGKLKAAPVERFERYTRGGGSTADVVPPFEAAAATAANAQQQQQHQQRAPPALHTAAHQAVSDEAARWRAQREEAQRDREAGFGEGGVDLDFRSSYGAGSSYEDGGGSTYGASGGWGWPRPQPTYVSSASQAAVAAATRAAAAGLPPFSSSSSSISTSHYNPSASSPNLSRTSSQYSILAAGAIEQEWESGESTDGESTDEERGRPTSPIYYPGTPPPSPPSHTSHRPTSPISYPGTGMPFPTHHGVDDLSSGMGRMGMGSDVRIDDLPSPSPSTTSHRSAVAYPALARHMSSHQRTQGYVPGAWGSALPPPVPAFVVPEGENVNITGVGAQHAQALGVVREDERRWNKGLRTVLLPSATLLRFLAIASGNTAKNLETCGLLLGREVRGAMENARTRYVVETLLIPKQHATSDTCTIDEEEGVLGFTEERGLITLGWIHTHPSQSCFMSSLDLHTHASFQCMLPESFAVVCAPKSDPKFGIFRLTDPPGLQTVLKCTAKQAFHPHPDVPIYTDADKGHVQMREAALEIVDLR